jgi:hypothetical protein
LSRRCKWRISLKAALAAMLGVCVGLAVMRALGDDPAGVMFGFIIVACSLGALVTHGLGRDAIEGIVWAVGFVLVLLLVAGLALMLMPAVGY